MDWKKEEERIIKFIRNRVKNSGTEGIVLGLSGGLDSAVVASLAIKAVGVDKVCCFYLPEKFQDKNKNSEDINVLCKKLGLPHGEVGIGYVIKEYPYMAHDIVSPTTLGNLKARTRMLLLYYLANDKNYIVLGTTNKSEYMIGYFTKWGDGACDIEPIQHLYKTEIFEFAKYLGIPKCIIDKSPSADLWEGQTDEGEIGMSYKKLDMCLQLIDFLQHGKVHRGEDGSVIRSEILEDYYSKVTTKELALVKAKIEKSQHKREPIPCLKREQ